MKFDIYANRDEYSLKQGLSLSQRVVRFWIVRKSSRDSKLVGVLDESREMSHGLREISG